MNITLHAAAEGLREMLAQVDPETGELPEGLGNAREIVERKAVGVVAWLLESERGTDAAEAYVKELSARIATERKRIAWGRKYLADHMIATGIMSIKDERGIFSAKLEIGRDKSVEIFDEAQVPDAFMVEVPATKRADKKAIRGAMDDGTTIIPGSRLVAKDRLTIK